MMQTVSDPYLALKEATGQQSITSVSITEFSKNTAAFMRRTCQDNGHIGVKGIVETSLGAIILKYSVGTFAVSSASGFVPGMLISALTALYAAELTGYGLNDLYAATFSSDEFRTYIESPTYQSTENTLVFITTFLMYGTAFVDVQQSSVLSFQGVNISSANIYNSNVLFSQAERILNNANFESFFVKAKHLITDNGTWSHFNVDTANEAKNIILDAVQNGTIRAIIDNGFGSQGQSSYGIYIDAGRVIGDKGQTVIKIIVDSLGNIWSAYPSNLPS